MSKLRQGAVSRAHASVLLGVAIAVLALMALLTGCAEKPVQKPLAASLPAEATLRALRLIGVDQAAVGEQNGTVTLRLTVPTISSAGDVEIAWQSAVGVLTECYPKARTYVVRLASTDGIPLVEFELRGSAARKADDRGDAARLRDAATVRYLASGEPAMPSGSIAIGPAMGVGTVTAGYLDAKNRAMLSEPAHGRPTGYALLGYRETAATRAAIPGRPAPAADQDAATVFSGELRQLLARPAADAIEGVDALRALTDSTTAAGPERVLALRSWIAVVEATTAERPFGDVTDAANATARAVRLSKPPALNDKYQDGTRAAAILAAAQSPGAPAEMKVVTRFAHSEMSPYIDLRQPQADATATTGGDVVTESQIATMRAFAARLALDSRGDGSAPVVSWESSAGVQSASSPRWIAYLRRDGRVFWLLGKGGAVALTDASLDGWAWKARRIGVVDAKDVSRVLSTIEIP